MSTEQANITNTEQANTEGIWLSTEEKEEIEKKLVSIADFQRLSSLLIWLGLAMVILHIGADIFFHVLS
jgi:hypothetical protein